MKSITVPTATEKRDLALKCVKLRQHREFISLKKCFNMVQWRGWESEDTFFKKGNIKHETFFFLCIILTHDALGQVNRDNCEYYRCELGFNLSSKRKITVETVKHDEQISDPGPNFCACGRVLHGVEPVGKSQVSHPRSPPSRPDYGLGAKSETQASTAWDYPSITSAVARP